MDGANFICGIVAKSFVDWNPPGHLAALGSRFRCVGSFFWPNMPTNPISKGATKIMNFQINLLRFAAIVFDLFGLACFFLPQQMVGLIGYQLTQPSAIGEVRATYGGLSIGIAIFLWLCANPTHARLGLRLMLLVVAGLMIGRIVGIAIDGPPNIAALALLTTEVGFTVASLLALRTASAPAHLQTA
jgi:hypothetical protein